MVVTNFIIYRIDKYINQNEKNGWSYIITMHILILSGILGLSIFALAGVWKLYERINWKFPIKYKFKIGDPPKWL